LRAVTQFIWLGGQRRLPVVAPDANGFWRGIKNMPSQNPLLSQSVIEKAPMVYSAPMTVQGAVNRTAVLLSLVMIAATFSWTRAGDGHLDSNLLTTAGGVLGFVFCLVTVFKKEWSPVTAPIYSLCQGLALGGVSASLNRAYPGVALQASLLSFGVLFALLGAYRFGWIRASEKFKAVVIASTLGVGLVYLVSMAANLLFGVQIPFLHGSGDAAMLFSLAVIVIAAMNLIVDFSFFEEAAAASAPRYMEWYAAFGLMVSLIWLYLEILRLLSNLSRRK
jgi:uncharacterized YccA/Bax inhibitor family protein